MQQLLRTLVIYLATVHCFGQDFKSQFNTAFQQRDTTTQLEILKQWESVSPKDAELYTSYFNYYFYLSQKEVLSIKSNQPEGESLAIQDSIGETAGYIDSEIIYLNDPIEKAFEKIDKGIKLYPNRLDMRFGKIYVLGQMGNWADFTDEIVKTVKYSSRNDNKWTWTNNVPQENGQEFFLSSLQDYQLDLYNTGDDALLANMRTIAQEILKYYPENVESLSNIGITYIITEEYDKGIEVLKKAESLSPEDAIVIGNLAHGYKLKGDTENAILYYQKLIEADPNMEEYAREQLEELKNGK